MCASQSLLGLPPLTLAVSCSAGITAAAASVGVHLLQLDQPPTGGAASCSCSRSPSPSPHSASVSRRCSTRLTLPATKGTLAERRISNESAATIYLAVPNRSSALLPDSQTRRRGGSFLSLKEHGKDEAEERSGRRHPAKRISFNLPPQREEEERRKMMKKKEEEEEGGGRFPERVRRSLNSLAIVRQLRRWSAEGEHHPEAEGKRDEDEEEGGKDKQRGELRMRGGMIRE